MSKNQKPLGGDTRHPIPRPSANNPLLQQWYCVERMHLPPETATYIIAGHWDPHVGTMVADSFEPWQAVEKEQFETEDEAIGAGIAILDHICALHNEWLSKRTTPPIPTEGERSE